MSTLPRPTGKELACALERAGFFAERIAAVIAFCGIQMAARKLSLYAARTLGLELLRKVLADCSIERDQLNDLL